MSDVPEIRMREKCATCAFRPGTEAANSPLTPVKARLCIKTCTPFLCHESPIDAMCAGAADAMTVMHENGQWAQTPEWKRKVLLACLDAIQDVEDGKANAETAVPERVREALAAMD
jgi:hypothetical protein